MRKYYIQEEDEYYEDMDVAIDSCIAEDWHTDDDYFEDWVNDQYDYITINGETYYPYTILEEIDQSNLNDLKDQYCEIENDTDRDNARYELRHARTGAEITVQGYTIVVVDEEEEETESTTEDIDSVRERLKEKQAINIEQTIQAEKDEKDLMSMFQIVGE